MMFKEIKILMLALVFCLNQQRVFADGGDGSVPEAVDEVVEEVEGKGDGDGSNPGEAAKSAQEVDNNNVNGGLPNVVMSEKPVVSSVAVDLLKGRATPEGIDSFSADLDAALSKAGSNENQNTLLSELNSRLIWGKSKTKNKGIAEKAQKLMDIVNVKIAVKDIGGKWAKDNDFKGRVERIIGTMNINEKIMLLENVENKLTDIKGGSWVTSSASDAAIEDVRSIRALLGTSTKSSAGGSAGTSSTVTPNKPSTGTPAGTSGATPVTTAGSATGVSAGGLSKDAHDTINKLTNRYDIGFTVDHGFKKDVTDALQKIGSDQDKIIFLKGIQNSLTEKKARYYYTTPVEAAISDVKLLITQQEKSIAPAGASGATPVTTAGSATGVSAGTFPTATSTISSDDSRDVGGAVSTSRPDVKSRVVADNKAIKILIDNYKEALEGESDDAASLRSNAMTE